MPLSHFSKVYAVSDAKIAKVTADTAGGSVTYATAVDVPGIKSMTITGDINTVELRGDNTLLDLNSILTNISVSIEYAKLSFDVLPVVLGGTTSDSGTTPNQITKFDLASSDTFNYFKLEGKTPTNGADTIGGDMHFTLHKCILSSFPEMGLAEEDYRTFSMEARATPLLATGNKWLTVTANETATAIS